MVESSTSQTQSKAQLQDLISLRDPALVERLEALQMGRSDEDAARMNRRLQHIVHQLEEKFISLFAERDALEKQLALLERRSRRLRKRYAVVRGRHWLKSLTAAKHKEIAALPVIPVDESPQLRERLAELEAAHLNLQAEKESLHARSCQLDECLSQERLRNSQAQEQLAIQEVRLREQEAWKLGQETWKRDQEQALSRAAQYDQELGEMRRQVQDREQQLRAAQLHLAKKVRENTMLRDQMEQQKLESLELQKQVSQLESVSQQIAAHFEREQAVASERQRAADERANKAELQARDLQDRLFVAQERFQEEKRRLQELERIESEYQQMVSVFTHLRSFVGTPFKLPPMPMNASISVSRAPPQEEIMDLFQLAERSVSDGN